VYNLYVLSKDDYDGPVQLDAVQQGHQHVSSDRQTDASYNLQLTSSPSRFGIQINNLKPEIPANNSVPAA
jgi:hypothetical protein